MTQALEGLSGHALLPTQSPLGFHKPAFFVLSDAARDPDGDPSKFRGFGLFIFVAGSNKLYVRLGPWTHHEEKFLEIDALELIAGNFALYTLIEILKADESIAGPQPPAESHWVDVCQVFDNSSVGTYVANTGKASGPTRKVAQERTRLLIEYGIRIHSEHSVRETHLAQMSDELSKGNTHAFEVLARAVFPDGVSFEYLEPMPSTDARRGVTLPLQLAIAAEKRKRKRKRCQQQEQAAPTVRPPPEEPKASEGGDLPQEQSIPSEYWRRPQWSSQSSKRMRASLQATQRHFRERQRKGVLRPSETERMHTLPFLVESSWLFTNTPRLSHPNNRFRAPPEEVMAHADVPLSEPASTTPTSYHLATQRVSDLFDQLRAEKASYEARCAWFESLGPVTPRMITHRWREISTWVDQYLAEIKRCELNPKARFNYSNIVGGRDGIRFPEGDISAEFRGLYFIVTGVDSPVRVRHWVDPQSNTEIRLDRLWEYIYASLSSPDPFPDIEIAFELCHRGLSNRSELRPTGFVLAPNYKKLWQHPWLATAQQKLRSKHVEFDPPRVSEACAWFPRIPGAMAVANMATDQLDANGNIKPRLTLDHGFGGRPGQLPQGHADPSINGNTNQQDPALFPRIQFLRMDHFARACAILLEAGEPMAQSAEDCEAYYEQLPRYWQEAHYQLLCMESAGIREDTRLQFGVAAECHTSNRVSFLFTWIRRRETRAQQRRCERATSPA